ncbi:sugar phosphate permease [Caulobacter sp. AP07]|uniref:MFS transporter n=1 Tax=Caulobacter sp. AP07 TaxID=1144304 RepID=UPI000271F257|nr:MFS transporter [Caulobacter sp. AP07]EJL35703.1 sugar phosphate permease [Caulobacter sp. AP07]
MSRKIANLRWWMIGLVMLGAVLNYLTRSTLGVAAPTVLADLHIGPREYSWITGVFQLGVMLQPLCGYVLDSIGLKYGFALFATAWSLITMAHGLANSWPALMGLRGLLGLAEGSAHPAGMKAVSTWFPARERGLAGGVYNIGASMGSVLAPPLVAWAIIAYNWRAAFVVAGGLGLAWVALWLACYQSPDKHKALSDAERQHIVAGQEAHLEGAGEKPSILKLLARRDFWGIALPRFLADPTWGTLAFWVPLYLTTVRHFDLAQIALFAWLPFVAADLGCLFGPVVVLFLQKRGVSLINARRWAFTLGALMMTGMMFVGSVQSPYAAIALLCLGGFAHQTLSVTVITMSSDLFRRSEVATVAGMAGLFGNLGVLIFSLLIGGLVATIGYSPFFVALGVLDLLGALLLWSLVRDRPAAPAAFPAPAGSPS